MIHRSMSKSLEKAREACSLSSLDSNNYRVILRPESIRLGLESYMALLDPVFLLFSGPSLHAEGITSIQRLRRRTEKGIV